MHKKVNAVSAFFIITCICSLLTGCSALSFIKEAWEDASNFASDYDDGLKSLSNYSGNDLTAFMSLPERRLKDFADMSSGEKKNMKDFFNNDMESILYSSKDAGKGQVLYVNTELKSGTYNKDRLNCILKDTKMILDTYKDSCNQLFIIFRDSKSYISWYTFIDNISDNNVSFICCEDYINYIKYIYSAYFSIENKDYFYQCKIPFDVYDIDIDKEFKDSQLTSADMQIQYKQTVPSDIVSCLDEGTQDFEFVYEIYPDDEENSLTVIMYPEEGKSKKDNMYGFWSRLISLISDKYEHYSIIRRISKDGEVVHNIRDGEELEYKLDYKKWYN